MLDTLAHAEYLAGHWKEAADAWDKAFGLNSSYFKNDPICAHDPEYRDDARKKAQGAR